MRARNGRHSSRRALAESATNGSERRWARGNGARRGDGSGGGGGSGYGGGGGGAEMVARAGLYADMAVGPAHPFFAALEGALAVVVVVMTAPPPPAAPAEPPPAILSSSSAPPGTRGASLEEAAVGERFGRRVWQGPVRGPFSVGAVAAPEALGAAAGGPPPPYCRCRFPGACCSLTCAPCGCCCRRASPRRLSAMSASLSSCNSHSSPTS